MAHLKQINQDLIFEMHASDLVLEKYDIDHEGQKTFQLVCKSELLY